MFDAAFRLTGSVGLLFKKQIKVNDLKFKELFVLGIPTRSKAFLVFLAIAFLYLRAQVGQIFTRKSV